MRLQEKQKTKHFWIILFLKNNFDNRHESPKKYQEIWIRFKSFFVPKQHSNCVIRLLAYSSLNSIETSLTLFLFRPFSVSFSLVLVFPKQVLIQLVVNEICRWLYSNHRSLVLEATTLTTASQPLPKCVLFLKRCRC